MISGISVLSERGGDVVGKYPLRLAFRAREGDVVGFRASKGGDVAPSRVSSEGG